MGDWAITSFEIDIGNVIAWLSDSAPSAGCYFRAILESMVFKLLRGTRISIIIHAHYAVGQ